MKSVKEFETIESNYHLPSVERHSRVQAGPGSGKTYWLTHHIDNILKNGQGLNIIGSRILCISHTNVAVNEIKKRLGDQQKRVEVATIHAWLYRVIVKPYLHLLCNEQGDHLFDCPAVDGHDEHRPRWDIVEQWLDGYYKKPVRVMYMQDWRKLSSQLCRLRWTKVNGDWILKYVLKGDRPKIKQEHLNRYKEQYWRAGILDHDDVLYCAYRILQENPRLAAFITARYPYLIIDEFQDTNPLQTAIVEQLATYGAWVTVIGDPSQSIYGFTNARPEDFDEIKLLNCINYYIPTNRRSTKTITNFLNAIRPDHVQQDCYRDEKGDPIILMVGPPYEIASQIRTSCESLVVLVRKNSEAAFVNASKAVKIGDLWSEYEEIDRNRSYLIQRIMQAQDFFDNGNIGEAIRYAIRGLCYSNGKIRKSFTISSEQVLSRDRRKMIAMELLRLITTIKHDNPDLSVLQSYREIKNLLSKHEIAIPDYKSGGKAYQFVESKRWNELRCQLPSRDTNEMARTIHKAKGEEYENVLVYLDEKNLLSALSSSDLESEDHRIFYVACSRAKDRLWINVETLSHRLRALCISQGFIIQSFSSNEQMSIGVQMSMGDL